MSSAEDELNDADMMSRSKEEQLKAAMSIAVDELDDSEAERKEQSLKSSITLSLEELNDTELASDGKEQPVHRRGRKKKTEVKQKYYPQRYRTSWETLDYCKNWLRPHPTNKLLAFCKVCDRTLHARRNDLRKHSECERHKTNEIYYERGTPVKRGGSGGSPYKARFHPSMMDDAELKDWLSDVPGDPFRAWCRWCRCGLTPQVKSLRIHGQSRKHQGNRGQGPYSPPPEAGQSPGRDEDDPLGTDPPPPPPPPPRERGRGRGSSPLVESDFSGRVTYSIGLGNRKVGFLGAGQIAQAIAQGMLEQGLLLPHDVMASAPSGRNMSQWKRWKCRTTNSNDDVLQEADIVFLAVKSSVLTSMVEALEPVADGKSRLFISVIPGVSRARVIELLSSRVLPLEQETMEDDGVSPPHMLVVRCAPNKMMSISAGFCAYCMGEDVPHSLYLLVETMFSALGTCVRVDESLMDAYSTMVGSGAAFTCAFIEAMAQGGVSLHIPWDDALKAAAAVVAGASKMLMRTASDPSVLRKAISTPGGSTIVGLASLQRGGLDEAVVKAMDVTCRKTAEAGSAV